MLLRPERRATATCLRGAIVVWGPHQCLGWANRVDVSKQIDYGYSISLWREVSASVTGGKELHARNVLRLSASPIVGGTAWRVGGRAEYYTQYTMMHESEPKRKSDG